MDSQIAIFDIGKTNKKLFVFNQDYEIVYKWSGQFAEVKDENGFPCEDLATLHSFVFESLQLLREKKINVTAINFSTYGASLVYLDAYGEPFSPLYNYLKPYPENLKDAFFKVYGGEQKFAIETSSPVLGSLNSGMQLYRTKHEQPKLFDAIKYALHLPQYMSYILTRVACSDITSIGCHTSLWNFENNEYHDWAIKEGVDKKLAPIVSCGKVMDATVNDFNYKIGIGLHDSSAALIPYLIHFEEPFILISTGTWCISLNPFNDLPLTVSELENDCLCYLNHRGQPIKAARFFGGHLYEEGVIQIADHFGTDPIIYKTLSYKPSIMVSLKNKFENNFEYTNPVQFSNDVDAYYALMVSLVKGQCASTELVLNGISVNKIFVDGGFSKNEVYMKLMAASFPNLKVYAASMPHATALGSAMIIQSSWNKNTTGKNIIQLKQVSLVN